MIIVNLLYWYSPYTPFYGVKFRDLKIKSLIGRITKHQEGSNNGNKEARDTFKTHYVKQQDKVRQAVEYPAENSTAAERERRRRRKGKWEVVRSIVIHAAGKLSHFTPSVLLSFTFFSPQGDAVAAWRRTCWHYCNVWSCMHDHRTPSSGFRTSLEYINCLFSCLVFLSVYMFCLHCIIIFFHVTNHRWDCTVKKHI